MSPSVSQPTWSRHGSCYACSTLTSISRTLAFSVEQRDDSEYAVLVDSIRAVVELSWQPSTATISERVNITGRWRVSPYRADVQEALDLQTGT